MALEDVELGGRRIERGQQVALAIGAANRDPARFDDPDAFEVARRDNHHIAFGFGIHYCFGAPLARLQAQIVVRALIDRMPSIGLEDASVSWRPNIVLRGLQALPVRFAASDRVA
jgi:cytochrome P450